MATLGPMHAFRSAVPIAGLTILLGVGTSACYEGPGGDGGDETGSSGGYRIAARSLSGLALMTSRV